MFKVSYNWLSQIIDENIKKNITLEEILKILNLQGFEVKLIQDFKDDKIITIEVKANRPDMLSHTGVAREILSFLEIKYNDIEKNEVNLIKKFPIKINIEPGTATRFCALVVKGVNNNINTPEYIRKRLEVIGIKTVNVVVDIQNYMMFELGQPSHVYDLNKIKGKILNVKKSQKDEEFLTLTDSIVKIKKGDIIIEDEEGNGCVAGIIGSKRLEIENSTIDILIESASFNKVSVRVTSRRIKISTPSSFRFERGVSPKRSLDICKMIAKKIVEICGGEVFESVYDYYPNEDTTYVNLRISRSNLVLGVNLNQNEIIDLLEKYDFKCEVLNNDEIKVEVPDFRLDIKIEEDLIEEVARSFGYDNIEAKMPIFRSDYKENIQIDNCQIMRMCFQGMGFNEIITYSFIPINTLEIFGIKKGQKFYSDIVLQNPISPSYALMRPTMAYSMLQCMAFNYSVGNQNLALFEFGRVYFRDNTKDTGCVEIDTFATIFSGKRLEKGFDLIKDIKYSFYDLTNYLAILFGEFGLEYKLIEIKCSFFVNNIGYEIQIAEQKVGILGEINKNGFLKLIPNVKLLKDSVFFMEIYTNFIIKNRKKLKFESKFPSVVRQYNFLVEQDVFSQDIIDKICNSSNAIIKCTIKDIYENSGKRYFLFEVTYRLKERTLKLEEIEQIESVFLVKLQKDLKVVLKT